MNQALTTKVQEIVARQLEVDAHDIMLEMNLKDHLGADSLDLIALVVSLCACFDLIPYDQEIHRIQTVAELIHFVETQQAYGN